jgi:hypothetical protein
MRNMRTKIVYKILCQSSAVLYLQTIKNLECRIIWKYDEIKTGSDMCTAIPLCNAGIAGYSMTEADEPGKVLSTAFDNKYLTSRYAWKNYLTQKL